MFGRKILRELNAQRAEAIADRIAAERRSLQVIKVVVLYSSVLPRPKVEKIAADLEKVIAGHQAMEDTITQQAKNIRWGLPIDTEPEPETASEWLTKYGDR